MPFVNKRSTLTPQNARAADVAHDMTERIAPMQQQRMLAAFRVQGVQAILYNRLSQGIPCSCKTQEKTVMELAPDGKAQTGAINRVLTNEARFGTSEYKPLSPDAEFDDIDNFHDHETSPNDAFSQWMGDVTKAGADDGVSNLIVDSPVSSEGGEFSPDMDELFKQFDLGSMGLTDVSCPICYGSGYVGGFSPFRSWRQVFTATQVKTNSTLVLPELTLRPGTHSFQVVLPRGALVLDLFRPMNDRSIIQAQITIDGQAVDNRRILAFFDGQPHLVTMTTDQPFTHFEIQAGLTNEPVYFEFPKRTNTADIALPESEEPFQIILSPDVPYVKTLDVIAESQEGKLLIVQTANPWQTRNRQFLGWECTVRVSQPQELWNLLPARRPVSGQQTARPAQPSKSIPLSGSNGTKGFSF